MARAGRLSRGCLSLKSGRCTVMLGGLRGGSLPGRLSFRFQPAPQLEEHRLRRCRDTEPCSQFSCGRAEAGRLGGYGFSYRSSRLWFAVGSGCPRPRDRDQSLEARIPAGERTGASSWAFADQTDLERAARPYAGPSSHPDSNSLPRLLRDLELNGSAGLPLNDRSSGSHPPIEGQSISRVDPVRT